MRPPRHRSSIAAVAPETHGSEVELRSILLFFALLSAFIAILTLRAHRLTAAGSGASGASRATVPTALAARISSPRPDF
jgi:hypothetical protein